MTCLSPDGGLIDRNLLDYFFKEIEDTHTCFSITPSLLDPTN